MTHTEFHLLSGIEALHLRARTPFAHDTPLPCSLRLYPSSLTNTQPPPYPLPTHPELFSRSFQDKKGWDRSTKFQGWLLLLSG